MASGTLPKTVFYAVLVASALFFLLGVLLLPYPGLHNDECLFVQPFYGPTAPDFKIHLFGRDRTLMLMTYLGTAKTLLYVPIFKIWRPSVWSIRLPGLITGAATIWMFGLLLYRLSGSFTAIAGAFLLALDPSNLLTAVFDWGPVALQHFLLVAAVLALYDFHRSGSTWKLAGGFFALGLAMWDKALFSWMLSGLVVASLLFLLQQIRRRLTARNVAIAAGAFLLGSAPLATYNVRNNFETFRGNAKITFVEFWQKTRQAPRTLDGSGLFGYLIREETDDSPRAPQNAIERFSSSLRRVAGPRREGWLPEALMLALACLPFWRARWRVMAFALVIGMVAWILMASTVGAGASVHHIVLLWPVPHFLVAFGLASAIASRQSWLSWAATGIVAAVCILNVLVINQYLYNAQRVGASSSWTDAIFPLKDRLANIKPEHVNLMDWGAEFNLLALTRGRMDIRWGSEPGERLTPNGNDLRLLEAFLGTAATSVCVRHVEPIEVVPGAEQRFLERARERGFERRRLEIVQDRNGRPVFEIYRFVKVNP